MSFSSDVKDELLKVHPAEEHCRIAELSALVKFLLKQDDDKFDKLILSSDNKAALRKCFTMLSKTFNIKADVFEDGDDEFKSHVTLDARNCEIDEIVRRLHLDNPMDLLKRDCCKRSYLRGVFLAAGYIEDPKKGYHFEILTDEEEYAKLLTYLLSQFNILAKRSIRKKYFVVYIKESEAVSDVLSVMGAHKSMMGLANTRIEKNVRNNTNRRLNCDIANVSRSVNAATKQIDDILYIRDKVGLDALPESLKEMALIRAEYPEESFTDLGNRLNPPVGKSGVNHRLRKISDFADSLRSEKEKK
ncbi:MAG: DNA-binding protein WhiA [Lachnospiraceae bacterium]|nr:DNA-binding protein WhiA [Lachnospiraceae bacterium]